MEKENFKKFKKKNQLNCFQCKFDLINNENELFSASAPMPQDGEVIYKDWVFINYTFKRFEGLTQRGTPTKK